MMRQFIKNIFDFLYSIMSNLSSILTGSYEYNNAGLPTQYGEFMNKNIFLDNSFIGLNMTYKELLLFFGTLLITIICIILFIKFFLKLLGLFRLD